MFYGELIAGFHVLPPAAIRPVRAITAPILIVAGAAPQPEEEKG